jgi:hypothetical protein
MFEAKDFVPHAPDASASRDANAMHFHFFVEGLVTISS